MSENLFKNRILSRYLPQTNKNILVLVTGARQTGKTTLCRKEFADLRYINLDAPENRSFINSVNTFKWDRDIGEDRKNP